MLKTLPRIRCLLQCNKVNEMRTVARHTSSYDKPRGIHPVQPRPVIWPMISATSVQSRPLLLTANKATTLLPSITRNIDLSYYWINKPDDHTVDALNGDSIGYDTFEVDSDTMNCSSILKKRKHKMNKHKYKKRRKRDKFKRRNLENIKERKQKTREKADERAKQAAG